MLILLSARDDLAAGFDFYERQQEGLGNYFQESLFSDIESLGLYAGFVTRNQTCRAVLCCLSLGRKVV